LKHSGQVGRHEIIPPTSIQTVASEPSFAVKEFF
jgi:hypothetical protein